ncbi:MAG: serine/threonine protein kinase [Gemmataceae bacterium]
MSLNQEVSPGFSNVEALCNALSRHRVLAPEEIRQLYSQWKNAVGLTNEKKSGRNETEDFCNWLVQRGAVTKFQLELVERGYADQLHFGSYKILARIGKGRMAGVYQAINPQGESFAVKVLPPSKATNPIKLARFQREAQLAVQLRHPHIVQTIDYGTTESGLHYIVMELLPGKSLDRVLRKRVILPWPVAVSLALQLFRGLQYLYQVNYVHRDLKPSNLMILPGSSGSLRGPLGDAKLKILDIGLARTHFTDIDQGQSHPELTCDGVIVGTPKYMAPEQARSARTVDIRSDLYSAGCILYEMLAGRAPFTDDGILQQLMRHAQETPAPIRNFNPRVPPVLDEFVSIMLAKDPDTRFPTPAHAKGVLLDVWKRLAADKTSAHSSVVDLGNPTQQSSIFGAMAATTGAPNPADTLDSTGSNPSSSSFDPAEDRQNGSGVWEPASQSHGSETEISKDLPVPQAVFVWRKTVGPTTDGPTTESHDELTSGTQPPKSQSNLRSPRYQQGLVWLSERCQLSRREWICLLAGAGLVLVFQVLVLMLWRLFS